LFLEDFNQEDTSLKNNPKIYTKMSRFYYSLGLKIVPHIAKIGENRKLKEVSLRTEVLCLQTYNRKILLATDIL